MDREILEKKIRHEIAQCELYRKHQKISSEGKYCNLEKELGYPIDCPYISSIIWIEKEVKFKDKVEIILFPYHSCSL